MSPLEELLAQFKPPTLAQPTTEQPRASYQSVLSALPMGGGPLNSGGRGGPRAGGIPWEKFGGDTEVLYKGVAGHEGSHLHAGASEGPIGKLLRKIERMGFSVGEHPKFGGVNPVHTQGSLHDDANAGDINWRNPTSGRASRFNNEHQALLWLERWLNNHGLRTN